MKLSSFVFATGLIISLAGASAFAESPASVIREKHKVPVDGVGELWSIEWLGPTEPECNPEDPSWITCPCNGFAFGERGDLVLVRKRPGQLEERFSLSQFFSGEGGDTLRGTEGKAVLRRWDAHEKDIEEADSPGFAARVKKRPIARVMRFGDYDHDGRETEFILQIGTLPCGKRMSIVVGISRRDNRLHAFSSSGHPERPLVLQEWQWDSLRRAKGSVTVPSWPCGDHGSESETELELRAEAGRIYAKHREYACTGEGQRGKLIKEELY